MSSRSLATVAALALSLGGCQDFSTPGSDPSYFLDYPQGVVGDLPSINPGAAVTVAVEVKTQKGKPVSGVEVSWDDGRVTPSMQPGHSLTDATGLARTTWTMFDLPANTASANRVLRAYVPGARNNPVVYRVQVVICTRCGGGPTLRDLDSGNIIRSQIIRSPADRASPEPVP